MKGLVHIYCKDGKGKTAMVIGGVMRATGRGIRVLIMRFLKTDDSGEVLALAYVPGITLLPCDQNFGFSWEITSAQKQAASVYYQDDFYKAWEMVVDQDEEGGLGMLILDEIIGACNLGFVDEDLVLSPIRHRPEHMEVTLTGREFSEHTEERGGYITGMVMYKHPFEQGIGAREKIKY